MRINLDYQIGEARSQTLSALPIVQHYVALANSPPSNIVTHSSGHKVTLLEYIYHG